jgi:4-amino-4-deoxy-L-arabinose transferase-like glycosyltransferase
MEQDARHFHPPCRRPAQDLAGYAVDCMTSAAEKPTGTSFSLINLGIGAERSIVRRERTYLSLTLAVFLLFAIYKACVSPLWFDELFTLFVSRLSSFSELWKAMPADGQPPLQYLLSHLSMALLGQTEFALRLPEIVAYGFAGLLTYKIVRRHGSAVQALFALSLMFGAIMNLEQAHTARPYGLLMAFTALAFFSWQAAAATEHNRIIPLCGVALGLACAILSHHFGVIHIGIFLFAGEATRLLRRRRLDWAILLAVGIGLSALAITLPLARQSSAGLGQAILHSANFWARPTLRNLWDYVLLAALPLLILVVLFAPLVRPPQGFLPDSTSLKPVPAHEWIATGAFCVIVPVQVLLAVIKTGYSQPRYAVSTSIGLALLAAWGLPRLPLLRRIAQPLLALSTWCFMALFAMVLLIENLHEPIWMSQPRVDAVPPLLLGASGDLPIVVASAYNYPPYWWYATPGLRQRLTYLYDIPYTARQSDFVAELTLVENREYIPIPITPYASFLESHPRFLLLRSGDERFNWIESRLANEGWQLNVVATSSQEQLYFAHK